MPTVSSNLVLCVPVQLLLSLSLTACLICLFFRTRIPIHAMADITQLRQKTRLLVNPNPRTASSGGVAITSVAETLPSHRSVSSTAFVQDVMKREDNTAFHALKRRDVNSLVNPTNELSRLGMDRWIEKMREDGMSERNARVGFVTGLVGFLAKPLAIISPFLVALAGEFQLFAVVLAYARANGPTD